MSEPGMALHSTGTNGPFLRRLWLWMKRAMTSLPVPLSPRIMTVASVAAARRHFSICSSMAGLRLCGCVGLAQRLQPAFQRLDLVLQRGVGERPLHHQQQILALERLLQVVECAVAHGQHRALHRAEGGEKDDGQAGMRLVQPREDLFARHPGHPHVQQHQVGRIRQSLGQALRRDPRNAVHGDAGQPQHALDVLAQRGFVVDHEDAAHSVVPPTNQWYGWPRVNRAGGISTTKLAPPPSLVSYRMRPSYISSRLAARNSPSPSRSRPVLCEMNGSNRCSRMLSGTPGPLSSTRSTTLAPAVR